MTTFTTQDRLDAQRAPLTDDQIRDLHKYIQEIITNLWRESDNPKPFYIEYARAIERAHGIGE